MSKVTFNNRQSPFFRSLKAKVDLYLSNNKLQTAGTRKLHLKGIVQAVSAVALFIFLVFFTPPVPVALALCVLLGFNLALIGFNIMHEGAHNSFSRKSWLNNISAYSLNFLGGNVQYWKVKHNINHHTYTNIEGMDDDIDLRPFMRLHHSQPHYWFHRFQHVYFVLLYSLAYLAWIFLHDFQMYFSRKIVKSQEKRKIDVKEHIVFWGTKLAFVLLYFVMPVLVVGFVPALTGFLVVTATCGIAISIVFQLAHVVEGTQFPAPDEQTNKIEQEWAVHQVQTTANFATRSKLVSWLLGGLNFQVEHHLFPRISHVHYPQINQLVRQTCEEFGIRYLEFPSVWSAIRAHVVHIKQLSAA